MKQVKTLFFVLFLSAFVYYFSTHVLLAQKPSFEVSPQKEPVVDQAQTTINPSTVIQGNTLTITTKATDISGVATVSAYIVNASKTDVRKLTLSKTATPDTYKISWTTPNDFPTGDYTVDVEANDTLGYFGRNAGFGSFTVNAAVSCSTTQCLANNFCFATDAGQCHPTDVGKTCKGSPAAWQGICGDDKCICGETAANCALDCAADGCSNPNSPEILILDPSKDYPDPIGDLSPNANHTVMARALSAYPIQKVEFYLGGILQDTQTIICNPPNEYCWVFDTTGHSGELDIRAVGYVSSLAWCDATRHINIAPDTQVPTANITDPAAFATISGTYGVKVHATDNVGVTKIELYDTIRGLLAPAVNVSPAVADTTQTISWNTTTYPNGNYNLFAIAYDSDNNWAPSASVAVKVDNPCPAGQCKIWPNCYAADACHPTTAVQKCDTAGSGNWVSSCGDTSCRCSETNATCSADCPPTVCGANGCEIGETCTNCPADCGLCAEY